MVDGRGGITTYRSNVCALDFVARMCERIRSSSVVREQKDALCHVVEAANVCETWEILYQVEHRRATTRVTSRGQDPGRLVEHDPDRFGCSRDPFAINTDHVVLRIDRLADLSDDPIDRHTPIGYQRLRFTP
jgi:hypothetical protein